MAKQKCYIAHSRISARDAVSVLWACVLVNKLMPVIYASHTVERVAVVGAFYLICGTKLHFSFGAKRYLLRDLTPSSSQPYKPFVCPTHRRTKRLKHFCLQPVWEEYFQVP